jgi:hypothetical protein
MTPATASKAIPVRSPRNSSSFDERLPFYERFQYSNRSDDALPPAKVTPAEVAHFLLHLLVSTESMSLDHGRRVTAKWTKGAQVRARFGQWSHGAS